MSETRKDFDKCEKSVLEECMSRKFKQALEQCSLFYRRDISCVSRDQVSDEFWRREVDDPAYSRYQRCVSDVKEYYKKK